MLLDIAAILLLLLLLGFFAGAETALTAASRPLMHQLEREGDARAGLVNRLHVRKERLLGSILLGNTLVHILASALATSLAIGLFGEAGIIYATAVMTVVVLVFCEILPKTFAIQHANKAALFIARPMRLFVALAGPTIHAIHVFVSGLLRLVGARVVHETDIDAAMMELKGAIEVHTTQEAVQDERRMLRSILELDDVEVGEVMTHRRKAFTIDAALPPAEIVDLILKSPYTRIPLWRGEPDNIIGVVHAKDVLRAVRALDGDVAQLDVGELAGTPWFIPDSTTLLEQLRAFRERREHFALVVDEYGALMGVVTLEDILEEIVGDITDEHDVAVAGVHPQEGGDYVVDGGVTIRDLNREFEWRLPDEDANTIAGLLLHESRQIPNVGQVFRFHGFRFEVLRKNRNQIASIRITPPNSAS
ncbi:Mg2+ and Co2+ transporter CorB [Magnetospirillum sp. LM-5]|uniref:HlyC/CorC family transporter n=1 Tax=Magnetospirillum sp. LM-5 TaxID=2681466 RepID=UPI0013808CE5|nr:HlyC/CorC family transporter [Magnetospirillum sp. LM-5]CAA7622002.1 Mg2+ and Co2+ transporter CorB [Magnetospirillum sp. LM-5]